MFFWHTFFYFFHTHKSVLIEEFLGVCHNAVSIAIVLGEQFDI